MFNPSLTPLVNHENIGVGGAIAAVVRTPSLFTQERATKLIFIYLFWEMRWRKERRITDLAA